MTVTVSQSIRTSKMFSWRGKIQDDEQCDLPEKYCDPNTRAFSVEREMHRSNHRKKPEHDQSLKRGRDMTNEEGGDSID